MNLLNDILLEIVEDIFKDLPHTITTYRTDITVNFTDYVLYCYSCSGYYEMIFQHTPAYMRRERNLKVTWSPELETEFMGRTVIHPHQLIRAMKVIKKIATDESTPNLFREYFKYFTT